MNANALSRYANMPGRNFKDVALYSGSLRCAKQYAGNAEVRTTYLGCPRYYLDADGDSYGAANDTGTIFCTDPGSGYSLNNLDCDDSNAAVNPSAAEVCNGIDDNCNGQIDEGVQQTFYADNDGDSYGDANNTTLACSLPSGYVTDSTDCDDSNSAVNPAVGEACNGIDDNCNGSIDEGLVYTTYYIDDDSDGYGDSFDAGISLCADPGTGFSMNNEDCNDHDAAINPDAAEICNGIDDNCDGNIDEGLSQVFYIDSDGDGYGSSASTVLACVAPNGYVADSTDCNDNNSAINPGAAEICNGIDDNCNGSIDEGALLTFYEDNDGDGYGDANNSVQACSMPNGYVNNNTDCNDSSAAIHPGASETCNNLDDNCNGLIDDGLTFIKYYADADGDGYGNANIHVLACSQPTGYVHDHHDCDDTNPNINPSASEICNGIDDNCNGVIDDGLVFITYYTDADGDGYGDSFSSGNSLCSNPGAGYSTNHTDCNDANASIHPGATEICNGIDDNCNGSVDEGVSQTFYADDDGDGYGDVNNSTLACSLPNGYVSDSTDCDDNNAAINPAASEICNNLDDNCNGSIDEGLVYTTYYSDNDGDSYGDPNNSVSSCAPVSGYVIDNTDCNDSDAAVNPAATEICDGIDNNCNGNIDEGLLLTFYADNDGDSYGSASNSTLACSQPDGYVADSTDCNDNNPNINPGAIEIPNNGIDDNCNGEIDEIGVGIAFIENDPSTLSVFPNPTNGAFAIDLKLSDEENSDAKIEVLNLLGQIIISENAQFEKGKLQREIQLSDAAAEGMYLVKVTINNEVFTSQINLQK